MSREIIDKLLTIAETRVIIQSITKGSRLTYHPRRDKAERG